MASEAPPPTYEAPPMAVLIAAEGAEVSAPPAESKEAAPAAQSYSYADMPPLEVLRASDIKVVDGVALLPPPSQYDVPTFQYPSQEFTPGQMCRKCNGKKVVGLLTKKECPVCHGKGRMPAPFWWECVRRQNVRVTAVVNRDQTLPNGEHPYNVECKVDDDEDLYSVTAAFLANGRDGPGIHEFVINGCGSNAASQTGVTPAGWEHVAGVLHMDPPALHALRVFKVSNHNLRNAACTLLSNAIKSNLSITEAEFWHCDINDIGAMIIVQTLAEVESLNMLNLGRNRVGGPTKIALEQLVEGKHIVLRIF